MADFLSHHTYLMVWYLLFSYMFFILWWQCWWWWWWHWMPSAKYTTTAYIAAMHNNLQKIYRRTYNVYMIFVGFRIYLYILYVYVMLQRYTKLGKTWFSSFISSLCALYLYRTDLPSSFRYVYILLYSFKTKAWILLVLPKTFLTILIWLYELHNEKIKIKKNILPAQSELLTCVKLWKLENNNRLVFSS